MAKFDDVKKLNEYLQDNAFLDGFVPTKADAEQFAELKECPALPHAARWWRNMNSYTAEERAAWAAAEGAKEEAKEEAKEGDDDDFDLFESTEEDEKILEAERQRKADELAAKAKASGANRSQIVLDVKPWDDTTPMDKLEKAVRSVEIDGLAWGQSKLVDVGYGIKKLTIVCVVIDDLVSTDDITDKIMEFEDFVQSVDIQSFNKL